MKAERIIITISRKTGEVLSETREPVEKPLDDSAFIAMLGEGYLKWLAEQEEGAE